ncbi:MAG: S-adenosyl-l-methionine hydroxide adenosyltransferase family protein [Cyanophyceae cyanobacterium]
MTKRVIALLSDFGLQDSYVGVMKGIIATITSQTVIDLTHQIPPQNVAAGRFCLMNAFAYFPANTVYIAVVDPGVGSPRRGVAVKFAQGYLVGPDNGLFSGVLSLSPASAAVELIHSQYWRSPFPSATFHGRDIFAPVGAHLANGVSLEALGPVINPNSLVQLSLPSSIDPQLTGCVQYIDIFGNLITTIPATAVQGSWAMAIKGTVIPSGQTYSDVATGEAIALAGSHGWVEVAVNGGSAQSRLQVDWFDSVAIINSTLHRK